MDTDTARSTFEMRDRHHVIDVSDGLGLVPVREGKGVKAQLKAEAWQGTRVGLAFATFSILLVASEVAHDIDNIFQGVSWDESLVGVGVVFTATMLTTCSLCCVATCCFNTCVKGVRQALNSCCTSPRSRAKVNQCLIGIAKLAFATWVVWPLFVTFMGANSSNNYNAFRLASYTTSLIAGFFVYRALGPKQEPIAYECLAGTQEV